MSVFDDKGKPNVSAVQDIAKSVHANRRIGKTGRMGGLLEKKHFCLCHPIDIHRMVSMISGHNRKNYRIVVTVRQCHKCDSILYQHADTEVS